VKADQLTRLLDDMEEASAAALVISPHLDDAVLSCGALLAQLAPEAGFVRRAGLAPHPWLLGRAENASQIAGYRTQFAGLFRDGTVPTRPEIYWLPANDSTTAV
jgi:hypothetical protein